MNIPGTFFDLAANRVGMILILTLLNDFQIEDVMYSEEYSVHQFHLNITLLGCHMSNLNWIMFFQVVRY